MRRAASIITVVLLVLFSGVALAEKIANWAAPSTWTPPASASTGGVKTAMVTTYSALPFIPVTPCRVADTRAGSGFPAGYGPPSIGGGVSRNFTITGKCGIPSGAQAVSFNFTVWNTTSYGDFKIYPQGGTVSPVSTLNWGPGILMLANAAVLPLGSGGITVVNEGSGTVDLFFDVNGYYATDVSAASGGDFFLTSTGPYAIRGSAQSVGVLGYGGTYGVAGLSSSGAGVYGQTTGTAHGVIGRSMSGSGVGVYGTSTGANGVYGESTLGGIAGILGVDNAATDASQGVGGIAGGAAQVFGVQGQIGTAATAGSAGVHGIGAATAARSYGVHGENLSTAGGSSGVLGTTGGGFPSFTPIPAGVRGDALNDFGVLGVSGYKAVTGYRLDTATGATQAKGLLGYRSGTTNYAVYGEIGDFGGTGAKYFVEPHALDASKVIRYISLEGPESGTYFRGRSRTSGGIASIEVPDHFRMVSDEEGMTVHVTPVGHFAQIWIESRDLNQIVIRSEQDVEFDYIVHGVRRAFRNFNPIDESPEFRPESAREKLPEGLPAEIRARLVRIGIYNPDGTVNVTTAERLGWAQKWREEELLRQKAQQAQKMISLPPVASGPALPQ